ncbi:MAG: DUF4422 domain-containing protein [Lachnospiraceae bacterium]|nr:DUF4422 domain-containing protein [Lachnospiraceae bacterium]
MNICGKEQIRRALESDDNIVIYGAGMIAGHVYHCLSAEPFCCSISAFMVSEKKEGIHELYGTPVIDVHEGNKYKDNAVILIAVMDMYYEEIVRTLQEEGFKNYVSMTFESKLWEEVRAVYAEELWRRGNRKYLPLKVALQQKQSGDGIHIYRACSHMDKPLHTDLSEYDWEIPIQVGAALTQARICPVCDDYGENISGRNQEYCELTALYWIWKNDVSKYAGLCHYRRHFELDKEMIGQIAESDIDVVLTVPIFNFPDVRSTYVHDHIEEDWNVMMKAIADLAPDYCETARAVQDGVFYYAYNMFIARREILNDYSEWLFPILAYCEGNCSGRDSSISRECRDSYQRRYIGFLAERLMSIYFLHHEKEYRIVHAGKRFLT